MNQIDVFINNKKSGELFYNKSDNSYGYNYSDYNSPISLIMPCKKTTYSWRNKLHPIFDMNMPEGYLYHLFKNLLSKEHGYIDDFLVFSYLAPNIESRLTYKSNFKSETFTTFDMDEVLHNDTDDTFTMLLQAFLNKNSISGVQPKTLALLKNKSSLTTREYIIKTWGDEFPRLSENEFFCLKAVEDSGVPIPEVKLSDNGKFILVERFNYDKTKNSFLGFEEVLTLMGKNSNEKYNGSYEQVAKVIYGICTNKNESMEYFYKTVVMSYLLGNGDAHLKNFGILYNCELSEFYYAPAYDIVNTTVYMFKDRPALTISGNKLWFGKKDLLNFGTKSCFLSKNEAGLYYDQCIAATNKTKLKIEKYITENKEFKIIGKRMIDSINVFLEEKTIKELPDEIIRSWK